MINDLKLDMERKSENISKIFQQLNDHLKTNIVYQMNRSFMSTRLPLLEVYLC